MIVGRHLARRFVVLNSRHKHCQGLFCRSIERLYSLAVVPRPDVFVRFRDEVSNSRLLSRDVRISPSLAPGGRSFITYVGHARIIYQGRAQG